MPSYQIKQNSTAYPLVFLMVDSSDHISPKTGLSPTVTISKAGGAFGSPAGAVTEIANGWYKVAGNATDSGTLGPLLLHATATGADPVDALYEVVAVDPQATSFGLSLAKGTNLTGLNDIAATAIVSGGAITTSGGKVSGVALVDTLTTYTGNTPQTGDAYARLGAPAGASVSADLAAVKSSVGSPQQAGTKYAVSLNAADVVGNLPASVNAWTASAITTNITGNLSGTVGAVTGNVGGSVNSVVGNVTVGGYATGQAPAKAGDAMTLTTAYDAAKTAASQATADAIQTVTDHLATALELYSGTYRFTVAALVNAPSGAGGGMSLANLQSELDTRGLTQAFTNTVGTNLDSKVSAVPTAVLGAAQTTPIYADARTWSGGPLPQPATAPPTADQVAAKILKTPANLLATDASGNVSLAGTPAVNVTQVLGQPAQPATAPPTAAQIDAQLSGTHGSGTWGGGTATVDNAAIAQAVLTAAQTTPIAADAKKWDGGALPTPATAPPTAAEIRTEIDANSTQLAGIKATTDHLATAMELYNGTYRFTVAALVNGPSGTGGGMSLANLQSELDTRGLTQAFTGSVSTNLDAKITSRLAAGKPAVTLDWAADVANKPAIGTSTLTTTDLTTALTNQGYTTTRAVYLDRLDAAISTRQATGNVTVGGYAAGQVPAKAGDAMTLTTAYDAAKTAASQATADAIRATTDHLGTALELSGSTYRFTAAALATAPTGSGGTIDTNAVAQAVLTAAQATPIRADVRQVLGQAVQSTTAPPTAAQNAAAVLAATPTIRNLSAVTAPTVADCLVAGFADGAGAETISGTTYTMKVGTTTVRTFTLNDPANPTSRQ